MGVANQRQYVVYDRPSFECARHGHKKKGLKKRVLSSTYLPHTGSGIGASSGFHPSHLLSILVLLLWHRGCLSDITGALFCFSGTISGWFSFHLCFCVLLQSAFLHVFVKMTFYIGAYDHSVLKHHCSAD